MATGEVLLGLLAERPRHGYDLKRVYDDRFGGARSLPFGQVYATLARLLRDGLVDVGAVEPGEGPERKRYTITPAGLQGFERWLSRPEPPQAYLSSALFAKVLLALVTGKSASQVLDIQRGAHLELMRALTARKNGAGLGEVLVIDYALAHLEADMGWIELAGARLDALAQEPHQ
ncbi:MAG: PadR family transcriptional regulator [Acidimicrobiales bacterium]